MLRLPHIIQACPPRPLLRPLHNLHALDDGTVDLDPHLHADHHQPVAEQDRGVEAAAPDGEADAREGVAGCECREEDVAHARGVGVGAVEEAGAGGGGVEGCEVLGFPFGEGVWVFIAEGGGGEGRFLSFWRLGERGVSFFVDERMGKEVRGLGGNAFVRVCADPCVSL